MRDRHSLCWHLKLGSSLDDHDERMLAAAERNGHNTSVAAGSYRLTGLVVNPDHGLRRHLVANPEVTQARFDLESDAPGK